MPDALAERTQQLLQAGLSARDASDLAIKESEGVPIKLSAPNDVAVLWANRQETGGYVAQYGRRHDGPRFFLAETVEMFENDIDPRTRLGPMPATDELRSRYPEAYEAFKRVSALNSPDSGEPVVHTEPDDGRGIGGLAGAPAVQPRKRGRPRTRS